MVVILRVRKESSSDDGIQTFGRGLDWPDLLGYDWSLKRASCSDGSVVALLLFSSIV